MRWDKLIARFCRRDAAFTESDGRESRYLGCANRRPLLRILQVRQFLRDSVNASDSACSYSLVAKGHRLPSWPDASCSVSRPIAKRSARMAASLSSDVRLGLAASLRMSERCCSSWFLVPHSIGGLRYVSLQSIVQLFEIRNGTNVVNE